MGKKNKRAKLKLPETDDYYALNFDPKFYRLKLMLDTNRDIDGDDMSEIEVREIKSGKVAWNLYAFENRKLWEDMVVEVSAYCLALPHKG